MKSLTEETEGVIETEVFNAKKSRVSFVNEQLPSIAEPSLSASRALYNKIITRALEGQNECENYDNHESNFQHEATKRSSQNFHSAHSNRNDCCTYYALKRWTYMMLEKPYGHLAFMHRLFTFAIILLTIIFSALTTMEPIKEWSENILFYIELFVTIYFFIEYCLRVWSSDCLPLYRGPAGKIKFIFRPIMVIELLAFIFGVVLIIGSFQTRKFSDTDLNNEKIYFGPVALTILRFLQLVRLLYVDRKAHTWIILIKVCYKHKFELISSVYIGFITLLLSSYLIYHCEKSVPGSLFHTYSDAVYWSIITMTTIGYGDISPKTFYGKIIATALCVLGVAFWTLPGGIIGSGFAFKIEQRNKIKKFNRLVPAAAYLIQTWWRVKIILAIPPDDINRLVTVLRAFEPKSTIDENGFKNKQNKKLNEANHYYDTVSSFHGEEEREKFIREALHKQESDNIEFLFKKLRPKNLIIIRTILLLKFFVAQNKFKCAHKPYDFKDVIEQYTKGNMDILSKIKDLQRRLDMPSNNSLNKFSQIDRQMSTGRRLSAASSLPNDSISYKQNFTLLENRIDCLEQKLDQLISLQLAKHN